MDHREQIKSLLTPLLLEEVRSIRQHLHRYPELSFQEYETSAYIRRILDDWGIEYRFPFVKTGILAIIRGGRPGKRVALRADMDALPITEDQGLAFRSENEGVMHACGHDVHSSCLLGAIRILNEMKEQLSGELLFVFQPGEEKLPGGAKLMLEEAVFEDGNPDLIIAQHVLPELDAGMVGFRKGMYMASSDEIYITVKGKGGHGALRHLLRDPILMASRILLRLQEEVNKKAPAGIPTVLSFGKVLAMGATNVVPDEVFLEGTFRTMNEAWRKEAHNLITTIATETAGDTGGHCDIRIENGYPVLHNDESLTGRAIKLAQEFLGPGKVKDLDKRMTAEDFAWFTSEIPGMMYRLGIRTPGQEESHALHTSGFKVDEKALGTGISMLAFLAAELLK